MRQLLVTSNKANDEREVLLSPKLQVLQLLNMGGTMYRPSISTRLATGTFIAIFYAIFFFPTQTVFAQNFSSAESGGFKRVESAKLKEIFSEEITLRRVGTRLNDDLIYQKDGVFVVRGYTNSFEEKGKWHLEGETVCMQRGSNPKGCRFLYMNEEKFRLVSDAGQITGEGAVKK